MPALLPWLVRIATLIGVGSFGFFVSETDVLEPAAPAAASRPWWLWPVVILAVLAALFVWVWRRKR